MTFRIIATTEQLQAFERRCQTTERMFAFTLCQRFQIEPTEENLTLVAGWMQSARSMGLANWIDCGIRFEAEQQPPAGA